MKTLSRPKRIGIIILLLIALAALLYHVFKPAPGKLVLYGNVDQRQIELAFIDSERVAEVLVEEGAEVEPGQVLARLETRRLRDSIAIAEAQAAAAEVPLERLRNGVRPEEIDQARAAVVAAKAEVAFAELQYSRYRQIWQDSNGLAVSKQEVDETRLQLNVNRARLDQEQKALRLAEIGPRWEDIAEAEAVLAAQKNRLEELRNQLADAELKSPARAVVRSRLLEPGDMASPQRAVFSLAVLSPKWVRAYVSESDLGRMKYDMPALIYTDSHPEQGIDGRVGFISAVAEFTPKAVQTPDLRTSLVYEIRIYVEDSEDRLRLGMPATVTFPGVE